MAILRPNISPLVQFTETDRTFTTRNFGITSLGIAGEFKKGRAFEPIEITDFTLFKQCFGDVDPCLFKGTQQPIYEGAYIARQYLQESDQLFVTRILGLTGYDAGDAWGISFGAALDTNTVTTTNTDTFTATLRYANGVLTNATFSNDIIQELYDEGEIPVTSLGGSDLATGDVVSVSDTFIGDCETFTGARFNMTVTSRVETFICITGETAVGESVMIPTEVQDCVVLYSGGTVTFDSKFVITVESPIVIQNLANDELTIIPEGIVTLLGGTITHADDGSVTIEDGTIFLPNGDVFNGGSYKICDLAGNDAVYDCDTIDGINFAITTGTTIIQTPVTSGTTQQVISQIPSGLVQIDFTGSVIELSGMPLAQYDNCLTVLLRSFAEYDGDETLNFKVAGNVMTIESLTGGRIKPLDDFALKFTDVDGNQYEYITSFDVTKKNYIARVFGQFIPCCDATTPLYIEELFTNTFQNLFNEGLIYCIKPTVCYTQSLDNYKEQYQPAMTPWVVSELRGTNLFRLFRFHTFSDGNAANDEIKISITNIRIDNRTFDVEVRSYGDTDRRPVVLESFRRLTLRQNDVNYIGRRIGTIDGTFVLQSKYIIVEIAGDCQDESYPAGFEGYPIREYECAAAPKIFYKTEYESFERKRQVYLGISDTIGFDPDFFTYKGTPNDPNLPFWTGTTKGYHLDVNATGATVDSIGFLEFEVGNAAFQNESDTIGTDYEQVFARKFTFVPFGGFDGWDIHRLTRTNTDLYSVNGSLGQKGLVSQNFDVYADPAINDGQTVINSDFYAYLKGIRTFVNKDSVRINLLATPNLNNFDNTDLIEETIEMVERERCDTFYVLTTLDTASDGTVLQPRDAADSLEGLFDTNFAATYFPWGQFFDETNNAYLWLPPTAEAMRVFALTDKVARPWFAGAGKTRGVTQYRQARKKLTLDERDDLYEGRINPLATFRQADGTSPVYIWGNKTLQVAESALDRINVRRLLLYTQRLIEDVSVDLLFDQNDEEIRRQFESLVNPILSNIRDERGIFDFRVDIDRSDEAFNSNEMKVKIGIQPVRTLEYITIAFVLTPAGASFEDQ